MLPAAISKSVAQQLDRLVLYSMNRRFPDSFETSYQDAPSFEAVLAATQVDLRKTAVYSLSAPGEHTIWLKTMTGELECRIRVRPTVDPEAPLILYHHGFNELPYTSSWRRIFREPSPFPAHTVCIQAPFHDNWIDPFDKGFASLQSVYQIFAGSLRMMELVQTHFEQQGATYTVQAGVSWGGITGLLYEGMGPQTRAIIPLLASPNLAQVMWDISRLFNRPISVSQAILNDLLDFTPLYRRSNSGRVFPLLAENDLFFRMESHSAVFAERPLVTIPEGHITGFWRVDPLRQHILNVLEWAEKHPL